MSSLDYFTISTQRPSHRQGPHCTKHYANAKKTGPTPKSLLTDMKRGVQ